MLHNCSYGMLQLRAVMSCFCTEAAKVVSPQSYLLNYLYLQHFHIMAVLKSNKQSKPYNKGRRQEGAGTSSFIFNSRRDGQAMQSQLNAVPGEVPRVLQPGDIKGRDRHLGEGFTKLCIPALLLSRHTEIFTGMQTLFLPLVRLSLKIPNQKICSLPHAYKIRR